jgi:hypothetical protein
MLSRRTSTKRKFDRTDGKLASTPKSANGWKAGTRLGYPGGRLLRNSGKMAKLVFGMNQSLDGYVDHTEIAPSAELFRHFIEHVPGGSLSS